MEDLRGELTDMSTWNFCYADLGKYACRIHILNVTVVFTRYFIILVIDVYVLLEMLFVFCVLYNKTFLCNGSLCGSV